MARLFFDHFRNEIIFINPSLMVFAYDQPQPCGASHSIVRFAIPFLENINELKFVVGSFQEVLLFSTSFLNSHRQQSHGIFTGFFVRFPQAD